MKKTLTATTIFLSSCPAFAIKTCTIETVPASCSANTETCNGGYCTTTYKYTAATEKCTCIGSGCCSCDFTSDSRCSKQCPTKIGSTSCPIC